MLRRISANLCVLTVSLCLFAITHGEPLTAESIKILPSDLGSFHQTSPLKPITTLVKDGILRTEYFPVNQDSKAPTAFTGGEAEYLSKAGDKLSIELVRFRTDSEAFSLLTLTARKLNDSVRPVEIKTGEIGTASVTGTHSISFFKGTTFARISSATGNVTAAIELAQSLAGTIDKGEDEVPVLVKHLPDWFNVKARISYVMSAVALREMISDQPVLDAVSFDGGSEAVVANYGQSRLLIVEFTTPQFSIDNDQRIWARIAELKSVGGPAPSAYRRVGNYSVFVFNAPDEKTANGLIDQVKYEQVVQWLGDDPHLYERLQRYFTQTSAGVLIAVLKSSGLSLLFCLAAGALIGTMLFRHRRAQRAAAFSDAGGSVRLNLDDLTDPVNTRRVLPGTKTPEIDSTNS